MRRRNCSAGTVSVGKARTDDAGTDWKEWFRIHKPRQRRPNSRGHFYRDAEGRSTTEDDRHMECYSVAEWHCENNERRMSCRCEGSCDLEKLLPELRAVI